MATLQCFLLPVATKFSARNSPGRAASESFCPFLALRPPFPLRHTPKALITRAAPRRSCRAEITEGPKAQSANKPSALAVSEGPQLPAWAPASTKELADAILSWFGRALKPALVSFLIAALLASIPNMSLAASSGGRVGGSGGFSASRARSYSAPTQTYRAPSYGPSYAPSYSAPFFAPMPFFGFGPTIVVGGGGGGFGMFNFLIMGLVVFFIWNAVQNYLVQADEEDMWEQTQSSSVVRLQVGLMGTARQLQKDLEKMARRADTSTPEGLHYVLQESVLALLRNPDYCVYGYSTSEVTRDSYEGEQAFNRLSMEERSKFKEETLVNVDSRRKSTVRETVSDYKMSSEYIVVTIIAATEGKFVVPEIRNQGDLRSALTALGSITSEDLQAVEILWTPEDEEDTLSTRDLVQDYPLLRPL